MKKLFALILCVLLLPFPAASATGTVTVASVSAPAGSAAQVEVRLESVDVCSGNMNLNYDPSALRLLSAEATGDFYCIANKKSDGVIRLSFMSLEVISDSVLCTLTFTVLPGAEEEKITASSVKLYDSNSAPVSTSVITGSVTKSTVLLGVRCPDTAPYQSVKAVVSLGGQLSPAGGCFDLTYDPGCLSLVSVKPLADKTGARFEYNIKSPGLASVTFVAPTSFPMGDLCALVFDTVGNSGSTSSVQFSNVRMYDEESSPLDVTLGSASISVLVPSKEDPKLWAVGGSIEDGSATVGVVMEGRGIVCGGSFTLVYDTRMDAEVLSAGKCQISAGNGRVRVSLADYAPGDAAEELLSVRFKNAREGYSVGFESAKLYTGQSVPVTVVDIRPVLLSKSLTVTPAIDEVEEKVEGNVTTVSLKVDVADKLFYSEKESSDFVPMAAAYDEEGRMTGLSRAEETVFKDGISETELTIKAKGPVDTVSVFVVDAENSVPLCENITA